MRRATTSSIAQALLLLSLIAGGSSIRLSAAAGSPVIAVVRVPASIVAVDAGANRALIASSNGDIGTLTLIDATTGQVTHTSTTPGTIQGLDVDEHRNRAFVTVGGTLDRPAAPEPLLMLDARTGAVLRQVRIGSVAASLGIDRQRGRLFVLTTDATSIGYLNTLDTATGRLLHTAALGKVDLASVEGMPLGQALDTIRGRLYVATCYTPPSATGFPPTSCAMSVFDTATGVPLHTIRLGVFQSPIAQVPLLLDASRGRIMAGLNDHIMLLSTADGHIIHSTALGSPIEVMAGDIQTGHVFIASPGHVLTLDTRTGRVVRATPIPASTAGSYSLALASATGRLFVQSSTIKGAGEVDRLSVLDAATGVLVRTVDLGTRPTSIRAVDERRGRVFLTVIAPHTTQGYTGPGAVEVADGRTGQIRARLAIGQNPQDTIIDPRTGVAFVLDHDEGAVIMLKGSFGSAALAPAPVPATPAPTHPRSPVLRALALGGHLLASDARTGRIFVAGATTVSTLDARTGALVRTVPLPGARRAVTAAPAALAVDEGAGRVYVASTGTEAVVMLDARTGALLRQWPVAGPPVALGLAARTGRLFIGLTADPRGKAPGGIDVLDTRRGVLRPVVRRAGADPTAIAVDEATGRAFAANVPANAVGVLDIQSGVLLRAMAVGPLPSDLTVASGAGRVFVLDNAGVDLLDARTGTLVRAIPYSFPPSTIAIDRMRGHAFATDDEQVAPAVDMLDARTGRRLRTTAVDPTGAGMVPLGQPAIDEGRGRVYVLLTSSLDRFARPVGPGAVAVLDAATGRLLRRVALGDTVTGQAGETTSIALDVATDHLFVLTDQHVLVLDATRL